jgi:hypothetical protein
LELTQYLQQSLPLAVVVVPAYPQTKLVVMVVLVEEAALTRQWVKEIRPQPHPPKVIMVVEVLQILQPLPALAVVVVLLQLEATEVLRLLSVELVEQVPLLPLLVPL